MGKKVTVRQIVDYLGELSVDYQLYGDTNTSVEGFSSLSGYRENTITWLKKDGVELPTDISVCIVQQGADVDAAVKIICTSAKEAFF